jgi:hypothetical protein
VASTSRSSSPDGVELFAARPALLLRHAALKHDEVADEAPQAFRKEFEVVLPL